MPRNLKVYYFDIPLYKRITNVNLTLHNILVKNVTIKLRNFFVLIILSTNILSRLFLNCLPT